MSTLVCRKCLTSMNDLRHGCVLCQKFKAKNLVPSQEKDLNNNPHDILEDAYNLMRREVSALEREQEARKRRIREWETRGKAADEPEPKFDSKISDSISRIANSMRGIAKEIDTLDSKADRLLQQMSTKDHMGMIVEFLTMQPDKTLEQIYDAVRQKRVELKLLEAQPRATETQGSTN